MNKEDGTNEAEKATRRGASELKDLLCADPSDSFFDVTKIKTSEYPSNFIPKGGEPFVGVDPGAPGGDCSVKGFYKDGVFHVQEIKCT